MDTKDDIRAPKIGNNVGTHLRERANDVMLKVKDFGSRIPENVSQAGRAIDGHVHEHPRLDVAIVGGTGLVLGALFGRKFLRFAMLATGAMIVMKMYPRFEPEIRKAMGEWR
jgi:hypothetical protein